MIGPYAVSRARPPPGRRRSRRRSPAAARARARAGRRAASPPQPHSIRRRFWNTPPESTTRSVPRGGGRARQASTVTAAIALWKRLATAPGAAPAVAGRPPRRGSSRADRSTRPSARRDSSADRIAAALGRVARRLELDRRLALVSRRAARSAAQRGDRVEQPAHAGGHAARRRPCGRAPRTWRQRTRRRAARPARDRRRLGPSRPSPAAASQAHAIRHGWRIACAPPGSRTGRGSPDALEAVEAADQQLPAPDRAVGAVPGRRRRSRRRPVRLAVLGERRRQVGVVVLDADEPDAVALERVLGREVLGVKVVRDDLGRHREQALEVLDPLARTDSSVS